MHGFFRRGFLSLLHLLFLVALSLKIINEGQQRRFLRRGLAVIDQVQTYLPVLLADLCQRNHLGDIDNRRIQPGLHSFMQKDRIEYFSRRRPKPEGYIADAQQGMDAG